MSSMRYTDDFGAEAVQRVIERGVTMVDAACRIGLSTHISMAEFRGRSSPPGDVLRPVKSLTSRRSGD